MQQSELLAYVEKHLSTELALMQTGGYATAHPELTPTEKVLVYHYTNTGSTSINRHLFENAGTNSTLLGKGLAAALTKLPPYAGATYSAAWWLPYELREMQIRAACAGKPFQFDLKQWPAFLSTSLSLRIARQHLNYSPKNCLLFVTSRTGRQVEALSRYGPHGPDPAVSEQEVLFLPNARFEIVTVDQVTTFCEMELVEV